MLQVARLAPKMLGDSTELVAEFLRSQEAAGGGFVDREGKSDLYYTVFGIEGLLALRQPLPAEHLRTYLRSFGEGDDQDLIHLSCLIRCWAGLAPDVRPDWSSERLAARLAAFHADDGGYRISPTDSPSSLYGCFMAVGAYQDLGQPIPDRARLRDFIQGLRDADGGFANGPDMPVALVPSTAAAVCMLRQLGAEPVAPGTADWLLSCYHPEGGFRMHPESPMPDLLSTATALHALACLKTELGGRQEPCLDFIDTLWNNRGGFCGNWEDGQLDCEYTYYALLALGHLAL
jgi:geranylgeranyl transferase type-2 subunit beta